MQTPCEIVKVPLSVRSYQIEIGTGNLKHVGPLLASAGNVSRCEILTDENVLPLYAQRVVDYITASGIDAALRVVPAGEESKSIPTAEAVWDAMLEDGVDRKTVMVALGGGVVGDLAGFCAATYARGIRFLQIPTTLLSQVDSSVGGKVGVNLEKSKNMVGAFHQPIAVLIDTETLATLDEQQFLSGMGEIVKYAESLDADFFAVLENNTDLILKGDNEFLRKIIARCCQIKAEIVAQDETETTGLRAKLNFGHTFAHAFETLCGYGVVPHGLAVSVGSIFAAKFAYSLGMIGSETVDRMVRLHKNLSLPTDLTDIPVESARDPQKLIDAMLHDKKTERGRLRFVLPTRLGGCELVDCDNPDKLKDVLKS